MSDEGPFVGAVYESARKRARHENDPWRWKVIAGHAGDLWELARIGGNRTRRGNLLRTAAELCDPKKWRRVEVETAPPSSQGELLPR